MTSPRSSYGGGYYAAPSYPETPIYDMLVAERGTPQIAPIRVPSVYDSGSALPALPAPRPALDSSPAALPPGGGYTPPPQQQTGWGYPSQSAQQPQPQVPQPAPLQQAPLQQAPAPYVPQQAPQPQVPQRGYPDPRQQQPMQQHPYPQQQQVPQQQMRPVAPRPAAPRQMPGGYEDPYGNAQQPYPGRGY
ncbi:DUF6643 family protein [Streptomyces sulphureus]|uniref:DUF6643 family protein n=1 Tax=Streptomyces sulphureus TaxID=47758 RepID=UPI0004776754|nr:DUF6643 family protein [Streptomyces sulphureus]